MSYDRNGNAVSGEVVGFVIVRGEFIFVRQPH
jgi:hypothetical protein